MILLHKTDINRLPSDTPPEVRVKLIELVTTLDNYYGENRSIDDDGGYVAYLPKNDSFEETLKEIDIDFEVTEPEHVDMIKCQKCNYVNVLYLFNNEYGVNLIIPDDEATLSVCRIGIEEYRGKF